MSPNQKKKKAHLIKMCHILKKNKFPTDDNRKDYLWVNYEVESTKEMSIEQLEEFAVYLGYGRNRQATPNTKEKASAQPHLATQKQLDTITGIWSRVARDKSDRALREYIFRIVKIRPLHLATLTNGEAQKVVTGLLRMQKLWKEERGDEHDNN